MEAGGGVTKAEGGRCAPTALAGPGAVAGATDAAESGAPRDCRQARADGRKCVGWGHGLPHSTSAETQYQLRSI